MRAIRGDSFWAGFHRGAAGGGIAYLGKFVGSQQSPGAWLIGRQTAALGAAITRDAITGAGTLETLTFPLGPVRIHRTPSGPHLTLDLATVAGTIFGFSRPGARLDLGRSLATGAIVIEVDEVRRQNGNFTTLGTAIGGAITFQRDNYHTGRTHEIIAHEVVHVLQHDFAAIAFGSPLESRLSEKLPAPLRKPVRYLDLGTYNALWLLPRAFGVSRRDSPWEKEAYFLVQGPWERGLHFGIH